MKRWVVILIAVTLLGSSLALAQTEPGDYDDLVNGRATAAIAGFNNPTNSFYYKGMVAGNFRKATTIDELAVDFGSNGLWIYDKNMSTQWQRITTSNPYRMIAAVFGDTTDTELVVYFYGAGMWVWEYGSGYPGTWTQITWSNPEYFFATDDDNDNRDEIQIDFGSAGLYEYDWDDKTFQLLTTANPLSYYGLRTDFWIVGFDEGVWPFQNGIWAFDYGSATHLTSSTTNSDDHASANFVGAAGTAEELVYDFGASGLFLYDGFNWHLLTTNDPDRGIAIKKSGGVYDYLFNPNLGGGLWVWHYNGSYPGEFKMLTTSEPSYLCFVETLDWNGDGIDELLVDFDSAGLWIYSFSSGWDRVTTSDPERMVRLDLCGCGWGHDVVVDFGSLGLWHFNAISSAWTKLSDLSPD